MTKSIKQSRREELFKDAKVGNSSTDIASRLLKTINLANDSAMGKANDHEISVMPLLKDNPRYRKANRLSLKEEDQGNDSKIRKQEAESKKKF